MEHKSYFQLKMLTEDFEPGYTDEEDQTDTKVDQGALI